MDSKEKVADATSTVSGKLKSKGNVLEHVRTFFSKEKKEFDGLTQVRQASFVVAGLLILSLLSGAVGILIVSLLALAFLFLGIQGKLFAIKIMPKLPIIFLGALVLVICFWVISLVLWMVE